MQTNYHNSPKPNHCHDEQKMTSTRFHLAWDRKRIRPLLSMDGSSFPSKKKGFSICMYINPFRFFHTSVTAMKTKSDLHLFSPFDFTWRRAKKGPDRFYASSDALTSKKECLSIWLLSS
ncbi:hypothetical protein BTH41_01291 [Bacillus mycoides]|nr:hypothetical protein BTH41_01291 [Bacillus mycoides]